jgi:hypothetical protein
VHWRICLPLNKGGTFDSQHQQQQQQQSTKEQSSQTTTFTLDTTFMADPNNSIRERDHIFESAITQSHELLPDRINALGVFPSHLEPLVRRFSSRRSTATS